MADNTVQYAWIVRLVSNLKHLLRNEVAFVAGDLLWYPVQVDHPPAPCQAPDVMVAIGRPADERSSYKQWEEEEVAPQVVFEILSPSNSAREMLAKQIFYKEHGVLEMFFYDPESRNFWGFARKRAEDDCEVITPLHLPWTSPLLKIRFELRASGLQVFYPDGEPFKEPGEIFEERDLAQAERDQAQVERNQAQVERDQAQAERDQAQAERDQAKTLQELAFAKLRELGIDPKLL